MAWPEGIGPEPKILGGVNFKATSGALGGPISLLQDIENVGVEVGTEYHGTVEEGNLALLWDSKHSTEDASGI